MTPRRGTPSSSTASGTTWTSRWPSRPDCPTRSGSAPPGWRTSSSAFCGARPPGRCSSTRASWVTSARTASTSAASPSAWRSASPTLPSTAAALLDLRAHVPLLLVEVLDLVLAHVGLVALEVRTEHVRVVVARDEEEVVALERVQRRHHRRLAGVGDGSGRQALHPVGVVRRLARQIALVQVVVPDEVVGQQHRVDHGRIGAQRNALLETVVEDAGDVGPLRGLARLLFDDA